MLDMHNHLQPYHAEPARPVVNITDPLKNLYINDGNIPNGMLFAITYKDGEVFQHFGQTKEFKVFDSETGGSEILSSGQYSHGSLATLLEENGIEALICGGIGDGARNMLKSRGIAVYPGQTGKADDVAEAFIQGRICDCGKSTCHHDHECHCH